MWKRYIFAYPVEPLGRMANVHIGDVLSWESPDRSPRPICTKSSIQQSKQLIYWTLGIIKPSEIALVWFIVSR